MKVEPQEREAFLHFVELNTALWAIEDSVRPVPQSDAVVYIDLLSHDLHWNIRSLYIAKLMQKERHCRLVGVIGDLLLSRKLGFAYDVVNVMRLARSYGISEFFDVGSAIGENAASSYISSADTEKILAEARALPDTKLAGRVVNWTTPDGCRIGEYIFDTTLRVSLNPILADVRDNLDEVTREAHQVYNAFHALFQANGIEAFVMGHLCYTQWGMVADLALRRGGKVLSFVPNGSFSGFLLTRAPAEEETLYGVIREMKNALFEREYARVGELSRQFTTKLEMLFSSNWFLKPYYALSIGLLPKDLRPTLRRMAMAKLGWSDEKRPIVCVFPHCFAEQPRDDEQVYFDYYEWFVETLRIAAGDNSKNWIFKIHPANKGTYDVTDSIDRLKREFGHYKHIVFVENELARAEILAACDVAVTVRGSVAFELPIFGTPVIVAGRSLYSDMGFCYVADTVERYTELLTSKFDTVLMTKEAQARANFFLVFDKVICRVESTFVPFWDYELTGNGIIWNQLSDRIRHHISDLDPLSTSFKAMLAEKTVHAINPRYQDLLTEMRGSGAARAPAAQVTMEYRLGDLLTFGRQHNGISHLLSVEPATEDAGTLHGPGELALIGLVLSDVAGARGRLGLRVKVKAPATAGDLAIKANGRPCPPIALPNGSTQIHTVDLGVDVTGTKQPFVLEIGFFRANGERSGFRLDSIEVDLLSRLEGGVLATENAMENNGEPSSVVVRDFGPKHAFRGLVFNEQPGGSSALWFRTEGEAPRNSYIMFGQTALKTLVSDTLITAEVPASLLQERGTVDITLAVDGKTCAGPIQFKISDPP